MTDDEALAGFSRRLNEICDDMNVPPKGKARQTSLAKLFGVSQNATRKWLEGEGFCTTAMGSKIAAWASVSFDWLMTGESEKRHGGGSPLLTRYRQADAATRTLIDIALLHPNDPLPEGLSPSLRALVAMARTAIANDLDSHGHS